MHPSFGCASRRRPSIGRVYDPVLLREGGLAGVVEDIPLVSRLHFRRVGEECLAGSILRLDVRPLWRSCWRFVHFLLDASLCVAASLWCGAYVDLDRRWGRG